MRAMAGYKMRYKVRYANGQIRTVVAQSHKGAKDIFIARFQPELGTHITVWQDEKDAAEVGITSVVKRMKVTRPKAATKRLLSSTDRSAVPGRRR